jgi:hypothetical protein
VVLDLQEGLFQLSRDSDAVAFRQAMYAHAGIGQLFDLPVVLSSSSDTGPNGPLPQEFLDMYPTAPFIRRQGEVNAWDNPDFRAAVIAANKTQIIIGGITTEVCEFNFFRLALGKRIALTISPFLGDQNSPSRRDSPTKRQTPNTSLPKAKPLTSSILN